MQRDTPQTVPITDIEAAPVKTRKQRMKAVKPVSTPKLPIKTIVALIEAQYCYMVLTEAALRDLPQLPREPYTQALLLADEQLNTLLGMYQARRGNEKTQKMFQQAQARCLPAEVINV